MILSSKQKRAGTEPISPVPARSRHLRSAITLERRDGRLQGLDTSHEFVPLCFRGEPVRAVRAVGAGGTRIALISLVALRAVSAVGPGGALLARRALLTLRDRKSTRLNSSHVS